MALRDLLDLGDVLRLSNAEDPQNAVEFNFALKPKKPSEPAGQWEGILTIVVRNAHVPEEIGAALQEIVTGTDRSDVERQLLAVIAPFQPKRLPS